MAKTQFTKKAVSRITKATAIKNGGKIPKGSFASIAQSKFAKNSN